MARRYILNTVKDILVEQVAVIGENLKIRRFEKVTAENGCVVTIISMAADVSVLL